MWQIESLTLPFLSEIEYKASLFVAPWDQRLVVQVHCGEADVGSFVRLWLRNQVSASDQKAAKLSGMLVIQDTAPSVR